MTGKRPKPVLWLAAAALALGIAVNAGGAWAGKPNPLPECFKPWDENTATISYPERDGPFRVALANGFAGNDWRIEMIQSLKAWARRPENAMDIAELKIVSTGTDVAAQISAIDNMIAAGFDAIIFIAVNPTAFTGVIKRAKRAGTVLVPFDNILERLIPLLPVRLGIDLRNATVSAGGLRKSQHSPCLIRAFQQWEGTQHHALPEPRG